jgi:hypothetical protein
LGQNYPPMSLLINLEDFDTNQGTWDGNTISLFPGQELIFSINGRIPWHLTPALDFKTRPVKTTTPAGQTLAYPRFSFRPAATIVSAGDKIQVSASVTYAIKPVSPKLTHKRTPAARRQKPQIVHYFLREGGHVYRLPIQIETGDAESISGADPRWAYLPWGSLDAGQSNTGALAAYLQCKPFNANTVHILDASDARWRLIERNGRGFAITADLVLNRLNLVVTNDVITSVGMG